jgi:hypothetical protein
MLHKVGSQFIEAIIPEGRGVHSVAAPSYDSWEELAKRLRELGVPPEAIARVKSDFDSGKDNTSIDLP